MHAFEDGFREGFKRGYELAQRMAARDLEYQATRGRDHAARGLPGWIDPAGALRECLLDREHDRQAQDADAVAFERTGPD